MPSLFVSAMLRKTRSVVGPALRGKPHGQKQYRVLARAWCVWGRGSEGVWKRPRMNCLVSWGCSAARVSFDPRLCACIVQLESKGQLFEPGSHMPSVFLVGTVCLDVYIRCVIASVKCSSVSFIFVQSTCVWELCIYFYIW